MGMMTSHAALDETTLERIDPAQLPARFAMPDAGAEGGERRVTLDRKAVVLARRVAHIDMRIAVPVGSYRGVALSLAAEQVDGAPRFQVTLVHRDRALDVSLFVADSDEDVIAEWRRWAGALNLPLLLQEIDGRLVAPMTENGTAGGRTCPRRRYGLLSGRRPRFLARRKTGTGLAGRDVYRGEREIIAQD